MANNVAGLSSIDSERFTADSKAGRAKVTGATSPSASAQAVASPVGSYIRAREEKPDDTLSQLADALSTISPALDKYRQDAQKKIDDEEMGQLELTAANFRRDRELGLVDQTKIGELAPEGSPIVKSKIHETIGYLDGRDKAAKFNEWLLNNDDVRLDTDKRNAARDQFLSELLDDVNANGVSPFYKNGVLSSAQNSLREYEGSALRETASKQKETFVNAFQLQAADAFTKNGDIEGLIQNFNATTNLSKSEMNPMVVDVGIDMAMAKKDEKILDKIPPKALSAESQRKIVQARDRIQAEKLHDMLESQRLAAKAKEESDQAAMIEIAQAAASGKPIDMLKYSKNSKEVYMYARTLREDSYIDQAQSRAKASELEQSLANASRNKNAAQDMENNPQFQALFGSKTVLSQSDMNSLVLQTPGLTPEDKVKLIDKIPLITQEQDLVGNDNSYKVFNRIVGPQMDTVRAQLNNKMILQLKGFNPDGYALARYNENLSQLLREEYVRSGTYPKEDSIEARQLREQAAASASMETMARLESLRGSRSSTDAAPKANTQKEPLKDKVTLDGLTIEGVGPNGVPTLPNDGKQNSGKSNPNSGSDENKPWRGDDGNWYVWRVLPSGNKVPAKVQKPT